MHNCQCSCSAVRCCVLWYWQLRGKFNVAFLYLYSHLLATYITRRGLDLPFVTKVVFGECYLGRCDVNSFKRAPNFRIFYCLLYDGGYQSNTTKLHGLSSQEAAGITHTHTHYAKTHTHTHNANTHTHTLTPAETVRFNNDRGQNTSIMKLHSQNTCHFKRQPLGFISKTF